MKKISLMIAALSVVAAANAQITLYNGLGGAFDDGYWNVDGGTTDTGGTNFGGAAGQVFTDSGAATITGIEDGYVGLHASSGATGVLVQVFNFSGGVVGSLVGSQTISAGGLTENDSSITTGALGGLGYTDWDLSMSTSIGGLVSGQQYFVVAQLQSANEAYQGVTHTGNTHVFVNDESSFGNAPIYGLSAWTESAHYYGDASFSVDSIMKVTGAATPEPASLAVLGLGALALLRRRRR